MVECLTRDRGVGGSSLNRGTALCPCAGHFFLCLVLVQPRKIHPDITEKNVDWDVKNQHKQKKTCPAARDTHKYNLMRGYFLIPRPEDVKGKFSTSYEHATIQKNTSLL